MSKYKFNKELYRDELNTRKVLGDIAKNPTLKQSYLKITIKGKVYGFGSFDDNGKYY